HLPELSLTHCLCSALYVYAPRKLSPRCAPRGGHADIRFALPNQFRCQTSDPPLCRGGPALRLLKPAAIRRLLACFQVEALSQEGTELDAVNEVGGADRDRTGDPLLAKQVLSQLSY